MHSELSNPDLIKKIAYEEQQQIIYSLLPWRLWVDAREIAIRTGMCDIPKRSSGCVDT